MKALVIPPLIGLMLMVCVGCKQEKPSEAASEKSGEVGVAELQKKLDEALKK